MPKNINEKTRVIVAMSGGVDSSVAAYLVEKEGYDVVGVFLKFWHSRLDNGGQIKDNKCCDIESLQNARQVAERLDIPFYVIDVSQEFKKKVVDYYISEYEKGRTPNPCVECNKYIKFGLLWQKARSFSADYLATGHYVRKIKNKKLKIKNSGMSMAQYCIGRAKDKAKDQSYFLWNINKKIIPHLIFPLGDLTKKEVRDIAQKAGLSVHSKKDSQGVCFVPNDNKEFLKHFTKKLSKSGNVVDKKGNVLGRHEGLVSFTIGQREALGNGVANNWMKANNKHGDSPPLYVLDLDVKNNCLVIGENKDAFGKELLVSDLNIFEDNLENKKIYAQIRGGHVAEKCHVEKKGKDLVLKFDDPIRAITPGQSVVFYNKEGQLLGGGVIKGSLR